MAGVSCLVFHASIVLLRSEDRFGISKSNIHPRAYCVRFLAFERVKQPLTAIAANGSAVLALLEDAPGLHDVRESLGDIVEDSYRASKALDGIRALFRSVDNGGEPIDMNEIAREVLESLLGKLKEHRVVVHLELASDIPIVDGDRSQLQRSSSTWSIMRSKRWIPQRIAAQYCE